MTQTTLTRVKNVLDEIGIEFQSVGDFLIADCGADSLDTVEIVLGLEEEFNIEIKDGDIEGDITIASLVMMVEGLRKDV